jgi:alpha-glucoside transport system substrate-binding protein
MVDWVSGTELDTVLDEVEASWPEEGVTVEVEEEPEEMELSAEALGLPELPGTSVLVMGAFAGGDEEARFVSVNDRFTELTGIEVTYEGTRDFEVVINTRVEGGDPPDVALLPQPG